MNSTLNEPTYCESSTLANLSLKIPKYINYLYLTCGVVQVINQWPGCSFFFFLAKTYLPLTVLNFLESLPNWSNVSHRFDRWPLCTISVFMWSGKHLSIFSQLNKSISASSKCLKMSKTWIITQSTKCFFSPQNNALGRAIALDIPDKSITKFFIQHIFSQWTENHHQTIWITKEHLKEKRISKRNA